MAVDSIQEGRQQGQGQGGPGHGSARRYPRRHSSAHPGPYPGTHASSPPGPHPRPRIHPPSDPRRFATQGDDQGGQHPPPQCHLIGRSQPAPGPVERQEPPKDEQDQSISAQGLEDIGPTQPHGLDQPQAEEEGKRETGQAIGEGTVSQGRVKTWVEDRPEDWLKGWAGDWG